MLVDFAPLMSSKAAWQRVLLAANSARAEFQFLMVLEAESSVPLGWCFLGTLALAHRYDGTFRFLQVE